MIRKTVLIAGTALATVALSPAAAQDTPPQATSADQAEAEDTDIVVTATRREERLQDVPLAVTALNSETLTTMGVNALAELNTGRVAGLSAVYMGGIETALQFNIRGFGGSDAVQATLEMPVAFYMDGVNIPRVQAAGIDLVTPERVEILRGPQGQLFGRNAHSGVVQVVSKRPTGIFGGDFTVGVGNYSSRIAKGRLELPEIGGFRIQLSGMYRSHHGYMNNPYNPNYENFTSNYDPASHNKYVNYNLNGDFMHLRTYGGRIAIERDFGRLNFFYAYDNTKAFDDPGFSVLFRSDDVGTIYTNFATVPPGDLVFSNFSGPGGSQVFFTDKKQGKNRQDSAGYAFPRMDFRSKAAGHILNLTYDATDNITLRSITGQREVTRNGGGGLNAITSTFMSGAPEHVHSRMFSQELQAIYDSDIFDLTAGATYFEEYARDERVSILMYNCLAPGGVASATCVPGSSQATKSPHSANGFKRSVINARAYGVYAQGMLTLGPVELTAGIRYSDDTKKGARVIDRALGIDYEVGLNPVRRNRFHTSRWDPAFTVKYNLTDDINAYVRYAQGYRAGGSSVRSLVFSAFGEDEIKSWEIGFKSQLFDRRLTFNAAAFRNKIVGQQISINTGFGLNPPNIAVTDFINSPIDRIIKGLELEVRARLLPGLTVSGSYTYLHSSNIALGYNISTLVTFPSDATFSPQTGLIPSAAEIAAHPNSQIFLLGPVGTPKHAGSINVDYVTQSPVGEGELAFHVDWVRSSRYLMASSELGKTLISPVANISGCETTGAVRRCPFFNNGQYTNQFNTRLALRNVPINGDLTGEISLWVKNIFNRNDPSFAFASGINSSTLLQPPRTFGAEFRLKF